MEKNDINREGGLKYQSKFSKKFREIYAVCSFKYFYIFEKNLYLDPIKTLDIKQIKTVKADENLGNLCFVSYNKINVNIFI